VSWRGCFVAVVFLRALIHIKRQLLRNITLREADVANNAMSFGRRWEAYRPTKGVWFWSSTGCIVATIVVGFAWGGWVTGGTATRMANDAADGARAQLAAMTCVARFNHGPDAVAQLAALKKASSYQRSDMIEKSGWVTMPGSADPVAGAADVCVQKLMSAGLKTATNG
jgi:hypothetical protein